jgi:hypothetical protein
LAIAKSYAIQQQQLILYAAHNFGFYSEIGQVAPQIASKGQKLAQKEIELLPVIFGRFR